jgi:outer membrane protein assembly factor BamB
MKLAYWPLKTTLWMTMLALVVSTAAIAQMGGMGGGMMGPGAPGTPGTPNQNNGMHQGQGNGQGMGDALMGAMNMGMGGREMMDGPTVGVDGTAYVVRSQAQNTTGTAATAQYKHELIAVNVRDGSARWKLEIAGGMISEPALAKDGKIFLTLADFPLTAQNGNGMMNPGTSTSTGKSRLLIVSTEQNAARIAATIEVESDVLSTPKVAVDETGNYVVYVAGFERSGMGNAGNDSDSIAAGEKHLYAFNPDGRLRFRLKLGEARIGVPSN